MLIYISRNANRILITLVTPPEVIVSQKILKSSSEILFFFPFEGIQRTDGNESNSFLIMREFEK